MAFLCSAPSSKLFLCFFCFFYLLSFSSNNIISARAEVGEMMMMSLTNDALESMSTTTNNIQSYILQDDEEAEFGEEAGNGVAGRRSLVWKTMHYYISYGALSANRVPCPPRSGRSYYTNNCYKSNAPAQPYSRGCSKITRCRR